MSLTGSMKSDYKLVGTLTGLDFIRGYSAFEVAVINGFRGTEEEWLASLKGEKGDKGDAPVAGVDYFTESDKKKIVNEVLDALPKAEVMSF